MCETEKEAEKLDGDRDLGGRLTMRKKKIEYEKEETRGRGRLNRAERGAYVCES